MNEKIKIQEYECQKCKHTMDEKTLGSHKVDGQYYRLFCTECGSNQVKLLF